jgi:hypothetical protein
MLIAQVMFYVAVLSVDIRRVELSDIYCHRTHMRTRPSLEDVSTNPTSNTDKNESLQLAIKESVGHSTILLNSGFVLLSMVCSRSKTSL